jgi:site-specific recombinase XerD
VPSFGAHDLRRTFISTLLDAGVDLLTVCNLAGHSDVRTTALYDRRGKRSKQAAMQRFTVPYMAPDVEEPRTRGS